MQDGLSRRDFLGSSAVSLASVSFAGQQVAAAPATAPAGEPPLTRVRKIYLAKPVPSWPKPDLDVPAEIRQVEAELAAVAGLMPGVKLEGGELYRTPGEVPKTAAELGNPDGLLVFNLTSTVGAHIARLCATGLPVILFSMPYSGHDWSLIADLQKKGHRIVCLATSDFAEAAQACRLVRTVHLLRHTRILYVDTRPYPAERAAALKQRVGPEIVSIGPDRVNAAYRSISDDDARAEAREWIRQAVKVVEPSEDDIANAGRMYLALKKIMREEGATGVTINCLTLFAAKQLPAYPCLAFSKLNDFGEVGVCEGDVESTVTQVLFAYAFGVPGFVTDPVVDTSKNTVVHAHCVSATKMDGPAGERAPYVIRSHMEDNKGAALQVRMRVGQVITMAKLTNLDTMLISTGTITDTPELDRGCRTKITTRVADARKLLRQYASGLHRVIFYGDRVNAIRDLAALMQFSVVEEC